MSKSSKILRTIMMKRYLFNLAFRVLVFCGACAAYVYDKVFLTSTMSRPVLWRIAPLHILWLIFMITMLLHIFPTKKLTMALRKAEGEEYLPPEAYGQLELYQFVQDQNIKAWRVMLCWLFFNAIFGILYLLKIIDNTDLLMLTIFYYLCDYICILFYCPFQHLIMKNRCCVNCRIYDWGHFMMFTPMLFIRDFFSWSLFFTSCVVLIHWEIIYAKHPERFWYGSNQRLQCASCSDKTCQIKRRLGWMEKSAGRR